MTSPTECIQTGINLTLVDQAKRMLIWTMFKYDPAAPCEIHLTFHLADQDGYPLEWIISRQLLSRGLHRQTGIGDVQVQPLDESDAPHPAVELKLSTEDGYMQFQLPRSALSSFLKKTHTQVHPKQEGQRIQEALNKWLAQLCT